MQHELLLRQGGEGARPTHRKEEEETKNVGPPETWGRRGDDEMLISCQDSRLLKENQGVSLND